MANRDIVVMGASYGGLAAYMKLLSLLPPDFPAAVFIVLHLSANLPSYLQGILAKEAKLRVIQAGKSEKIEKGTVYVAPPNRHLLLKDNHLITTMGPRENMSRPSIDVLFRSAAVAHTTRVVAVLLTGLLDDGVSGLSAVKRCGGMTIVQDPAEAEAPDMPRAAIEHAPVDYILRLGEIAATLEKIVEDPVGKPTRVPEELMDEVKMAEQEVPDFGHMNRIGELTPFTCPECGGVMWSLKNEPIPRYLCHTGHSFTAQSYIAEQSRQIENSLWSAVRFMQERIKVLHKMAEHDRKNGRNRSADDYEGKIRELTHHAHVIRNLVTSGKWLSSGPAEEMTAGEKAASLPA